MAPFSTRRQGTKSSKSSLMYMHVCFNKAIFHYTKEINLQAALRHVVNCYIKYVRL